MGVALCGAAKRGDLLQVKSLLASGADVNGKNAAGEPALQHAAWEGRLAVVEELLARGAEVNGTNNASEPALHFAAWGGHVAVVKALLARGAEVNNTDNRGRTALHCAVEYTHIDVVQALLARGADVHYTNNFGNTPLHEAAEREEQFMALELWRAGADPLRQNKNGQTPLSLLPQHSDAAKQMRTAPRPHPNQSSWPSEIRQVVSFLACRSHSGEQTGTAEDAIPALQQALQLHLNQSGAEVTVHENDVEDAVLEQIDRKTGLLRMDAVIKSFYELQKKYPICKQRREPPELRTIFKSATRSKSEMRSKLAKLLLRELFDESGSKGASSRATLTFTRSRNEWNESNVDILLADHRRKGNVIDEEGFVKVGMKVLFA